ncbi:protein export chaperone secb [Paenibacillus lignilyticus]|uniref:Protein export chaperone secb n=1 Tax=Paenibacillus lignilyticus TaxID=1172615 RepID=A0ABS5CL10_9BACL|nr:protein export chaperone secb [Paenibacillus lignilyticus]MBP3966541.1 protein export chaperone secb [Paenibacillus lignilyticus]
MRDEILNNYFYQDGSLRDIYILQTHYTDWDFLMDYFKSNPDFEIFIFRDGEEVHDRLSIKEILNLKNDFSMSINIVYKGISISGYFYETDNIEFDISPREIVSLKEVDKVIEFMKEIAKFTNKEVILTPEMDMKEVYIRILSTGETIFL